MDESSVEETLDAAVAQFNSNIIPAIGFDPAGNAIGENAVHLDGMPRVVPSANIPPGFGLFILHKKRDEETFAAADFTGLKRVSVIAPMLVTGKGPDIFR